LITIRKRRGQREYLFLGLTDANIQRLMKGEPIRLTAQTHGGAIPEGWTIGILYGANKEELRIELERAGIIDPGTELQEP
jgi:hypothetical protein